MSVFPKLFIVAIAVSFSGCSMVKKITGKEDKDEKKSTGPTAESYVDLDIDGIMKFKLPIDESDGKFALTSVVNEKSSDACMLNSMLDGLKNRVVGSFSKTFCDGSRIRWNTKYKVQMKISNDSTIPEPVYMQVKHDGKKVYSTFCQAYKGTDGDGVAYSRTYRELLGFDLSDASVTNVSHYSVSESGTTKETTSNKFVKKSEEDVSFDYLVATDDAGTKRFYMQQTAITPEGGYFKYLDQLNRNRELNKFVVLKDQTEQGLARRIREDSTSALRDRAFSLQGFKVTMSDYSQYVTGGSLDLNAADLPSVDPTTVIAEPEGFWDCQDGAAVVDMNISCEAISVGASTQRNCNFGD